ncbi:MAG: hypothetical protein WA771_12695 [Chthoniobacterales bacterium]
MRAKLHPVIAILVVGGLGSVYGQQNNPPNLTVTGERYVNPKTYLFTGTVSDEGGRLKLIYRIKREAFEIKLRSRKNFRLRLKLRRPRTRLVFFAVDKQGRRSARQKRVIVQQAPQEQQRGSRPDEQR